MDNKNLGQYYDDDFESFAPTTNKGIIHEQNMFMLYRNLGMIPMGFRPPRVGGHGIDLKLFIKDYMNISPEAYVQGVKQTYRLIANKFYSFDRGKEIGIELKLDDEDDYGQSAMTYVYDQKKWTLTGRMSPENIENRRLLTMANVLSVINEKWKSGGEPQRFRYSSGRFPTLPKEAVVSDKENFPDTTLPVPNVKNVCANYYIAKQCPYINIASHGLYYFSDPLGLGRKYGARKFTSSVSSMGVRFRPKQGGSFGFNVAMKITGNIVKSRVNLMDTNFAEQLQMDAMKCQNAPDALKNYRDTLIRKGLMDLMR